MGWSDPREAGPVDGLAQGEVAAILHEEMPAIPVIWFYRKAAVSSGLEGAWIDPFEQSLGLQALRWAESTQPPRGGYRRSWSRS